MPAELQVDPYTNTRVGQTLTGLAGQVPDNVAYETFRAELLVIQHGIDYRNSQLARNKYVYLRPDNIPSSIAI